MYWLEKYRSKFTLKGVWHIIRSAWHVVRGLFPFTWVSIILIALMYYVWFWEVSEHANQILYAVVLVWLLAFAVILGFTLLSAVLVYAVTRYANRSGVLEEKNEVGGHISSGYRIFHPFFMPFVTIESKLLESGFERHATTHWLWEQEWLKPIGRGRFEHLHRTVTIKDIFGLTSITYTLSQRVSLEIQPAQSHFEMVAFQTQTSGDGYSHPEGDPRGELIEMRRYQAGDPLRLVLWKVFARSRKLVVRAPEPAIVEENDMFVYFVSGQEDENSASMARSFLSSFGISDKEELYFAADGANRLVRDEKEGISDIIDSVSHRSHGGEGLLTVAPLVSSGAMSHCFLLVPKKIGLWLEHVKKFIATYQTRPVFILSVDASQQKPRVVKPGRLKRFFCETDSVRDEEQDLKDLCKTLSAYGSVRIVDVTTGAATDYSGGAQ